MLAPGGPGCKSAGPCHLYWQASGFDVLASSCDLALDFLKKLGPFRICFVLFYYSVSDNPGCDFLFWCNLFYFTLII